MITGCSYKGWMWDVMLHSIYMGHNFLLEHA
jgi:hypothetical protein